MESETMKALNMHERVQKCLDELLTDVPMDRTAWMNHLCQDVLMVPGAESQDAMVTSAPPHRGQWSQRVADAGAKSLPHIMEQLDLVHKAIVSERTSVGTRLSLDLQRARTTVPEASAQAQQVAEEAEALRAELRAADLAYRELCEPTAPERASTARALASVHRLASVKQRMQITHDLLQAADSWSYVEADVYAFIKDAQYKRAAQRVADFRDSLAHFDVQNEHVSSQRALATRLIETLLDKVSPVLVSSVTTLDVEAVAECAQVLASLHKDEAFERLYMHTRAEQVQREWTDAVATCQSAPDAIVRLGTALVSLVHQEVHLLAPRLFGHASQAAVLLTYVLQTLTPPISTYMADSNATLPDVVHACNCVRTFAKQLHSSLSHESTSAAVAAAAAEPAASSLLVPHGLIQLHMPTDWLSLLRDAFAPYRATYRSQEEAFLAQVWTQTQANYDARLDRIWVRDLSENEAPWAKCVTSVAELLRSQVALAHKLSADTMHRMWTLTGGTHVQDAYAALTVVLYPSLAHRLSATIDTVCTRYRQHARRSAPAPARVLMTDDLDALHDWSLVRVGVQFLHVVQQAAHIGDELNPSRCARAPMASEQDGFLDTDSTDRPSHAQWQSLAATTASDVAACMQSAVSTAQQFMLELILTVFRQHIDAYSTHGAWRRTSSTRDGGDSRMRVPTFSLSPTEGMVRLGEGLLNLPRLLEALVERELPCFAYEAHALPYVRDDDAPRMPRKQGTSSRSLSVKVLTHDEANGVSMASSTDQILSAWLRSLTLTLLASVQNDALPRIVATRDYERPQLASDMDYLSTIASALNASSASLREWADVLQLEPKEAMALPTSSSLRASRAYALVWG